MGRAGTSKDDIEIGGALTSQQNMEPKERERDSMIKREIMKYYKKGTEIKIVSLDGATEARGHVVGYWKMSEDGWGVECLMVGEEKTIQMTPEDVIRVYGDKPKEKQSSKNTDKQPEAKQTEKTPDNLVTSKSGDVFDDEGELIRKAPQNTEVSQDTEELHPMEKAATVKVELEPEVMEELNKLDSIAARIRLLLSKGMGRSQVAKTLGVGYRYVYAIEHKPLKRELPLVIVSHNENKY